MDRLQYVLWRQLGMNKWLQAYISIWRYYDVLFNLYPEVVHLFWQQSVGPAGSRNCNFSPKNSHNSRTTVSREKMNVPSDLTEKNLNMSVYKKKILKYFIEKMTCFLPFSFYAKSNHFRATFSQNWSKLPKEGFLFHRDEHFSFALSCELRNLQQADKWSQFFRSTTDRIRVN